MRVILSIVPLAIISLIFPLYAYAQGQTAPLPTPTSQPQCVDFNSDKVCESIVLANGTMIPNPALEARPTSPTSSGQATNFATYQSPAMGIGIQYPLSWQLEEGNGKVVFVQQKDVVSLETGVDGDIGSSLSEYANTRLNELREQREGFKLIESTPTTISSNPAHKLLYTFVKEDGPRAGEINKVMRIWAIKDAKLYTIAYISELEKFPDYLPLAERMVDSIRIGKDSASTVSNNPGAQRTTTTNTNTDTNNDRIENDPCNYYGLNVCDSSGNCDNERFDCLSDDCVNGQSGTTGQCEGDDRPYKDNDNDNDNGNTNNNDPCNYYGLNVCNTSGECDSDRFDCASDDCVNGQSGTTGQCEGDDEPYGSNEVYDYEGACDENDDYCDQSEGCGRQDIDCIDDVNEGDDGKDELSCQPEDDFCEPGCESPSMDCIDDVNLGDDGEDSVPDEDEDTGEEEGSDEDGGDGDGGDGDGGVPLG